MCKTEHPRLVRQKQFWYISYTFTMLSYHEDGSVQLFISSDCMLRHHKQNESVASNLFGDSINGEMDLCYWPQSYQKNSLKCNTCTQSCKSCALYTDSSNYLFCMCPGLYGNPFQQYSNNAEVPVTFKHLLLSP